jgi:hypothetical protein
VSALRIRRRLARQRRRIALVAIVLAALIAIHHSGLPTNTHDGMAMGSLVEMCMGVLAVAGAALAAAGAAILVLLRPRPLLSLLPPANRPARPVPAPRVRHGPRLLSVLCVSRR